MLVSAAAAEIAGALTPSDVCALFGVCPNAAAALGLPAVQVGRAAAVGALLQGRRQRDAASVGLTLRRHQPRRSTGLTARTCRRFVTLLPRPVPPQGPFDCPFCKLAVATFIARIEVGAPPACKTLRLHVAAAAGICLALLEQCRAPRRLLSGASVPRGVPSCQHRLCRGWQRCTTGTSACGPVQGCAVARAAP